jgi:transposase
VLSFPVGFKIYLALAPVDMRKQFNGLWAAASEHLGEDPRRGAVFVFANRTRDRVKLLYWDGTGLVMAYKRLEEHTFTWPAVTDGLMLINHAQFEALFAGLDWRRVRAIEAKAPEAVE